jgi:hypothetical protein
MNREEINKVMSAGTSVRDVARTYAVSKSAADRHRRMCLPGIKARAREVRVIERNMSLVPNDDPFIERVEDHATKMEMIRDSAMKNNDDKTAIAAGREVRGAYEVLGKATAKFQPIFGIREQQPMFILPEGAHIAVTVNQQNNTIARDVTPRAIETKALPDIVSGEIERDDTR